MAVGYTLYRGHRCTDYTMTWLGRRVELELNGVPVGTVQGPQLHIIHLSCMQGSVVQHLFIQTLSIHLGFAHWAVLQ